MTRRFFLGAAGSTGAAGAFALRAGRTAEGGPRRPPNILWIVTDDHRPDSLGCTGPPGLKTPHLDGIARRGVSAPRSTKGNP